MCSTWSVGRTRPFGRVLLLDVRVGVRKGSGTKNTLKGVFYVLDVKGGVNAPVRAHSLVQCEGWQQKSAEHPEHAHMGVFGVFSSREGVRETTNMQNTPTRACFACLGCGVGEEHEEHEQHAQMGVFFVFLVVAAVLWSALGVRLML